VSSKKRRIHWLWIPPFLIYTVAIWIRKGPVLAVLTILLGVVLIVVAEVRASRRNRRQ
jgi:hypothetical protein